MGLPLEKQPKHWVDMDPVIGRKLLVGDILYGNLDELTEDHLSFRRVVVARPSERRILLISTSMAPQDEAPSEVQETFIATGDDLESKDIGSGWSARERRIALKAAEDAIDGTIKHAWLRIWDERHLHIVARVARAGLHDSLQTITATRPEGSFFRKRSTARMLHYRPMPKVFVESGFVTAYGRSVAERNAREDLWIT